MILIIKYKSVFNFFISMILGIFDCKVLITSSSESFLYKQLVKLGFKLRFKQKLYLNMSEYYIENIGVINGDLHKISDKCVETLCKNINYISSFDKLFPNIKNLQRKLKLFIYEYFDELFFEQQSIIIWLKSSPYKDKIILNYQALKPGAKIIWRDSGLKVIFLFNYFIFFQELVIYLLFLTVKYLFKILFKIFSSIISPDKKKINTDKALLEKEYNSQQNVLFFPHMGVVQFVQPPKDHFYSDQKESSFFPSNIIHLEYDSRADVDFEREKIRDYLKIENIHYKQFKRSNIPLLKVIKFFTVFFKAMHKFEFKNLKNNFLYYAIIFKIFILFNRYCNLLEEYKNAKIAFVGYEILFPKELALALEFYNIKTIANSERFLVPYMNNSTFILDTLLSVSEHSTQIIKNSDRFIINNILPVGQVRTDYFFDKGFVKSQYEKNVVILDYHIELNPAEEKFKLVTNWKNDISFRNEILSLAECNKDISFTFRGKNADWYNNKAHSHLKLRTEKLPNVKVDMDYSIDYHRSYHLCSTADLIIARPSSIAEECVSAGMDVIVMDYGVNYKMQVSKFLPEVLRDYYCNSYDELKEMFKFWKKYNYILTKEKKDKIKKEIFSDLTDGKVKQRIQNHLNQIYLLL